MTPTVTEPRCRACAKTAVSDDSATPATFLVCSRCQSLTDGKRKTYYCSKSCQTLDWPLHKPTICGKPLEPTRPSPPPPSAATGPPDDLSTAMLDTTTLSPALVFHLAALKTLSSQLAAAPPTRDAFSTVTTTKPLHPTPAYLFFPTDPLAASSSQRGDDPTQVPIPIHLSGPAHKLFSVLFHTAITTTTTTTTTTATTNRLSVTLMYSLLVTSIDALALAGGEPRLVEQLGHEFPQVDVRTEVERDEEPTEPDLTAAIGGPDNLGLLLEWQMEEAERLRSELA
ncbi:hypothetical protein JCM11491_000547 [Sporobolomyces phaffii]